MVTCRYNHTTDSAGITSLSGVVGRMVKEGDKTYTYGYLDKILSVQENGKQTAAFDYHVDGQIASATHGDKSENFLWDGLAIIHRGKPVRPAAVITADAGGTSYINEPYVSGGNPILSSKDGVMFNDMLGNTLGTKSADAFSPVNMTAFGETADKSAMFTGKPHIGELGYAFLFRNYRADQGKWQTADPLDYPDGWNNLAYVNNGVTDAIDFLGGWTEGGHRLFFNDYSSFAMYAAMSLNSQYVSKLISANLVVDQYQGESESYMHSMKTRTESSSDAIKKTNDFIKELLADARTAVIRYEQGKNSLEWTCNFIITQLGNASHTIQDKLCPEHFSDEEPQIWYSGWYYSLNVQHLPELFRKPSAGNINSFNSWIQTSIRSIIGNNQNIIRELFE